MEMDDDASEYERGDIAMLHGLSVETLNGQFAIIDAFIGKRKRWAIHVNPHGASQTQKISIRASNLTMVYAAKYQPRYKKAVLKTCLACQSQFHISKMKACTGCMAVWHCPQRQCRAKFKTEHTRELCSQYRAFASLELAHILEIAAS